MSNICTNIQQSEKLVRLGLDPATSDMWWIDDQLVAKSDKFDVPSNDEETTVHCAWSLSALLEVMPKVIVHDMEKHVLCLKYAEGVAPFMYYVVESGRNKGKLIRFDNGRCVPDAYDALDAAYKMVCWLLEQGFIKKGGQE